MTPAPTTGGSPLRVLVVSMHRDASRPRHRRQGWRGHLDALAARTERNSGGVQTSVEATRSLLVAQGVETTVVTPFDGWWPLPLAGSVLGKIVGRVNAPAAARWHRWWHRRLTGRAVTAAARRPGSDGAVWYAQDPASAAEVRSRVSGARRLVAMCHYSGGSEAAELVMRGVCPPDHPLLARIRADESAVLREVDAVCFVSRPARDAVLDAVGPLDPPLHVIPNWVDLPATLPDADDAGDLVSVGSLNPIKRHELQLELLAAARRGGRDLRLDVVGGGPELASLQAAARRLGVDDLVTFHGECHDVTRALSGHRALLHTSSAETFGLAVVEAMAQGLPAMVVPVGGLVDIVTDGIDGRYLPADDADSAARIVVETIDDADRLRAMGRAARETVEQRFTAAVVVPMLLAALGADQLVTEAS